MLQLRENCSSVGNSINYSNVIVAGRTVQMKERIDSNMSKHSYNDTSVFFSKSYDESRMKQTIATHCSQES